MEPYVDSTDRTTTDFVLFGLGFIGFLLAVTGIIISVPALALAGGFLLMVVILAG